MTLNSRIIATLLLNPNGSVEALLDGKQEVHPLPHAYITEDMVRELNSLVAKRWDTAYRQVAQTITPTQVTPW